MKEIKFEILEDDGEYDILEYGMRLFQIKYEHTQYVVYDDRKESIRNNPIGFNSIGSCFKHIFDILC